MTTFAAFSQRLHLPVAGYSSNAEGYLEFVDGNYRFTRVVLRPTVLVDTADAIEQTEKTLHDAHKKCLVTNSITIAVSLEPNVQVVDTN